jgi:hypothetical protein
MTARDEAAYRQGYWDGYRDGRQGLTQDPEPGAVAERRRPWRWPWQDPDAGTSDPSRSPRGA